MMIPEARWFGRVMARMADPDLFPMLNVGSNTGAYRTKDQPWIDRHIFAPLRVRGGVVRHLDLQDAPGVDLVGDLADAEFLHKVAAMRFRSVFCSNLLEHVPNREALAVTLVQVVLPGGRLFVSCPYRFPYHPDPIDTLYRPDAQELAGLFPGTRLVESQIVSCGTMATFLLRGVMRRPLAAAAGVGRRLIRRNRDDRQVIERGASSLRWMFRSLKATCVVLQRAAPV